MELPAGDVRTRSLPCSGAGPRRVWGDDVSHDPTALERQTPSSLRSIVPPDSADRAAEHQSSGSNIGAMQCLRIVAARTLVDAVQSLRTHPPNKPDNRFGVIEHHAAWSRRQAQFADCSPNCPGFLGCWLPAIPTALALQRAHAGGYRAVRPSDFSAASGATRGLCRRLARPLAPTIMHPAPWQLAAQDSVFFNQTNYDSYAMYHQTASFPGNVTYATNGGCRHRHRLRATDAPHVTRRHLGYDGHAP